MRTCLRSFAPRAFFVVAFIASGCMASEEEPPATAAPPTTGIPIGAPGAVGARVDPAATAPLLIPPPPTPFEQKINPKSPPDPGQEPVIPPSPFGTPPDDDQPPGTTKKKPKGTKI